MSETAAIFDDALPNTEDTPVADEMVPSGVKINIRPAFTAKRRGVVPAVNDTSRKSASQTAVITPEVPAFAPEVPAFAPEVPAFAADKPVVAPPPPLPAAVANDKKTAPYTASNLSVHRRTGDLALPPRAQGIREAIENKAKSSATMMMRTDRLRLLLVCAMLLCAYLLSGAMPLISHYFDTGYVDANRVGTLLAPLFLTTLFISINKHWSRVLAYILLVLTLIGMIVQLVVVTFVGEALFMLFPPAASVLPSSGAAAAATVLFIGAMALLGSGRRPNWITASVAMLGSIALPFVPVQQLTPVSWNEAITASFKDLTEDKLTTTTTVAAPTGTTSVTATVMPRSPVPPQRSSKQDFTLTLPPGWTMLEGAMSGNSETETIIQPADNSLSLRLQRVKNPTPQKMTDLVQRELDNIRKEYANSMVTDLPNHNDRKKIFAADGTLRMIRLVVLTPDGRRQFVITCRAERSILQQSMPQIEAMFADFQALP